MTANELDFAKFLIEQTSRFDEEIIKTMVPTDPWVDLLKPKKKIRRKVEPVITAIRKARRDAKKVQRV